LMHNDVSNYKKKVNEIANSEREEKKYGDSRCVVGKKARTSIPVFNLVSKILSRNRTCHR